ncbi:protein MAIN-LIKE 1-like, partial [Vigna umbellata]|uniref:protein MAIN-LIKE 1-like n=1 Tax=Vigna umbellata TaxID=87088 RepID=UPI001F5F5EFD
MSITLDDVSSLLHLPVLEQLCDLEELEFEEARTTLVELLGVDGGAAGAEMEDARGPKVRLSWLREIYVQRDVHACGRYAWGVAALAHLYDQLRDASLASTKQTAGFLTLCQHFPTMGRRRLVSSYDETTPCAARWQSPRQSSTLAEIRSQLDGLTYSGVVWNPYEGHRSIHPFFGICMYSRWIWIGDTLSRHLPERVMRRFGLYQEIPRPPTAVADADVVAVDYACLQFMYHVIMNVRQASYPYEFVDGYIQWFRRVSHPYIILAPPDARPTLAPTQCPNVPQEARPHRRSSPPSPSGVV